MKWKSWLLFLCPLVAFSAPKKDLHLNYIVSSNDVNFYLNQPIWFKISVCEKKEQLCTQIANTVPFTFTSKDHALHFVLPATLRNKDFQSLLQKRKIFWEDAKIKIEVIYARSDIFSKFVQSTLLYKELLAHLPGDMILKDSVNAETGIVEVSHLLIN